MKSFIALALFSLSLNVNAEEKIYNNNYNLKVSDGQGLICSKFNDYGKLLTATNFRKLDQKLFDYLINTDRCYYLKDTLEKSIVDGGIYKDYYYCEYLVYTDDSTYTAYGVGGEECNL